MGIEPTQPAWKAGALPLSYARGSRRASPPPAGLQLVNGWPARAKFAAMQTGGHPAQLRPFGTALWPSPFADKAANEAWWAEEDSNLRRLSHQIYSLVPLAARESARLSAPPALAFVAGRGPASRELHAVLSGPPPCQKALSPGWPEPTQAGASGEIRTHNLPLTRRKLYR